LKPGVRENLPEVDEITDPDLRERVVAAWAMALSETEFKRIDEIRPSGNPNSPALRSGSQADHLRGVARIALAMADSLEGVLGSIGFDRDLLLASALCHDIGKPFEFSPANQKRWQADPKVSGFPAMRHPVYGAHIAISAGLPEAVCHAAGGHSGEGELVVRSLENTIVHHADHAFWRILAGAGLLEDPE
jgi:putative nucleotidyltransferase with HDIG domain